MDPTLGSTSFDHVSSLLKPTFSLPTAIVQDLVVASEASVIWPPISHIRFLLFSEQARHLLIPDLSTWSFLCLEWVLLRKSYRSFSCPSGCQLMSLLNNTLFHQSFKRSYIFIPGFQHTIQDKNCYFHPFPHAFNFIYCLSFHSRTSAPQSWGFPVLFTAIFLVFRI